MKTGWSLLVVVTAVVLVVVLYEGNVPRKRFNGKLLNLVEYHTFAQQRLGFETRRLQIERYARVREGGEKCGVVGSGADSLWLFRMHGARAPCALGVEILIDWAGG